MTTEVGKRGTGFLFDHRGGLGLVTAAHVCSGAREEVIEFQQAYGDAGPVAGYLDRIGPIADHGADVAAFDVPESLRPSWFVGSVPLMSNGIIYGQDCYIVSYPFGLSSPIGSTGQEIPIIKRAVISGSSNDDGIRGWYVDAVANPGFSGGPLVFEIPGSPRQYGIAGVVRGALTAPLEEPHP